MKLPDLIAKWEAEVNMAEDQYEIIVREILADLRALELIPSEVREAVEIINYMDEYSHIRFSSEREKDAILLILNHVTAQCAKGDIR